MTQISQETVARAEADASWQGFVDWLSAKRLMLSALILIGAAVGLYSWVLNRGYFLQDDFAIAGLAAHPLSLHLLFQNYNGHLIPGVFALAWLPVHAGGYDWGLWAGTLVTLQALAGLALLRALRTLVGDRMLVLIPLGVFLFTPMALADLSWWSIGIHTVPVQLAIAMAVDQHVRYIRTGRILNAVFAAAWILFGLAFFEMAVAIPLLLFALTSAFLLPGSWPQAMLSTLRRHWIAWAVYAAMMVAEVAVYLATAHSSVVKVPQASSVAAFSWDLLWHTFAPAAVGGPWRWTPNLGAPRDWTLYAFAAPPYVLSALSLVLIALVVIASLWYRAHAWRAWIILVGWLLVVDVVPVALARLATFGSLLSTQTAYVADAAPVLAICLAIAFLPLRDEVPAYRTSLPPIRARAAVTGATAALFLTGSVWSASAYRDELHPDNSRSYIATASAALTGVPPDTVIYPSQIPDQMAWSVFGQLTQVPNALAPLVTQVSGQQFRFTSSPTGMVSNFMIFDAAGRLHPVSIAGPHSYPFRKQSQCLLTSRGMRLQLSAQVYPFPFLMQIAYYAAQPVTVAVWFGVHQYQVTLAATPLAYGYLPVQGPGDTVVITPVTSAPICIGSVAVGNVQASPTASSTPVFPVSG